MPIHCFPRMILTCIAGLSAITFVGCSPEPLIQAPVAEKRISATTRSEIVDISFDPSSGALTGGSIRQLEDLNDMLLRSGENGRALLAMPRVPGEQTGADVRATATVRSLLSPHPVIVAEAYRAARAGSAIVTIEWIEATVPGCPDWARDHSSQISRASSNWGCATEANLAAMVSYPSDLADPRPVAPADGTREAAAVDRYRSGKITQLIDGAFEP